MILFTSVTKNITKKTLITYSLVTIFLFVFSRIYQSKSYGEISFFMNNLYLVSLIGGLVLVTMLKLIPTFSRISYNLWNSGVAIITTGFLLRGIINLSGRSTTLDKPYWYVGIIFLLVAVGMIFFNKNQRSTVQD